MATLTTNSDHLIAEPPACPSAVFLNAKHADAMVFQFDFDASALKSNSRSFGPFEPHVESGRGVAILHTYTLQSLAMGHAERTAPWHNSQLLGQRFAELFIPVTFADRTPGRLILRQWTAANLPSLIAPRPFGIPVRSATIRLETSSETQTFTIREPGIESSIAIQLQSTPSPSIAPNPFLFGRPHAFTLNARTARAHRSEYLEAKASGASARLIDGSLFADLLPGAESLRLVGAQRVASCTVNTSLPLCLNGPACALSWNELKK